LNVDRRFFSVAGGRRWSCWLLCLFLLLARPSWAWNAAGHRLVAAIAWDQLDDPTRAELSRLLQAHPDYARWIRRARGSDVDRTAFIESATWPDDIRKDKRFYDIDRDQATSLLFGFPDMERHRDWHFVNRPLDGRQQGQKAISGQIDRQLVALTAVLGAQDAARSEQAYGLPWLIHLVGDAHQPLHAAAEPSVAGERGKSPGIINAFNSRKPTSTLHAFWDDLPGPPWLRGGDIDAASWALIARYPPPLPSTSGQWIDESWLIARNSAYPPDVDKIPTITAEFMEQSREIADRRVADAGYRLADLLRERLFKRRAD
jgi:hypothetical protein